MWDLLGSVMVKGIVFNCILVACVGMCIVFLGLIIYYILYTRLHSGWKQHRERYKNLRSQQQTVYISDELAKELKVTEKELKSLDIIKMDKRFLESISSERYMYLESAEEYINLREWLKMERIKLYIGVCAGMIIALVISFLGVIDASAFVVL